MSPFVSILMPVRNGRFLAQAVETLLAQSLRDFDFVIVDDGCDARTQDALAQYAKLDARIRIERYEENSGLAAALNFGIGRCSAPLIARADADDEYHPERLARQVAALEARPDLAAISCGWHRIDERGRRLYTQRQAKGPELIRFLSMFGSPLLHPGAVLRAEALTAIGGYDPAYWTAQDTDLWARLLNHFELDNLPEPLVQWRVHNASISASRGEEGRRLSLGVRARQQRAYLRMDPDEHLVAFSTDLLARASLLPVSDLAQAERYLARFLAMARHREKEWIVRAFRRKVASALFQQARWAIRARLPSHAVGAARRAALWQQDGQIEGAEPIFAIRKEQR